MKSLLTLAVDSFDAVTRMLRNHAEAILELQRKPCADARVLTLVLADGQATPVSHGLGRAPRGVFPSAVRGAVTTGRIEEIRGGTRRDQTITLKASGWGGPIELEVLCL